MTRKILLMRHAKSDWNTAAPTDRLRPLNLRGQRDAPLIGTWLAQKNHLPDVILTSDAVRARETCSRVVTTLGDVEDRIFPEFYDEGHPAVFDALRALDDDIETAMVIAHQPGMALLTRQLTAQMTLRANARAYERFSTASVAVLLSPDKSWGGLRPASCEFTTYIRPKELLAT